MHDDIICKQQKILSLLEMMLFNIHIYALIEYIITSFEEFVHKISKCLFGSNFIHSGIRVEPSNFTIHLLKCSDPVGSIPKFILCFI